jgi:hypothetical protein
MKWVSCLLRASRWLRQCTAYAGIKAQHPSSHPTTVWNSASQSCNHDKESALFRQLHPTNGATKDEISTIVRRAVLECLASEQPRQAAAEDPLEIFNSAEVNARKEGILRVGKKLCERQYVDGNGGNISVRVSPHYGPSVE